MQLVNLATEDGRILDAALYEVDANAKTTATIVYVHGKGGNFYSGEGRFIPEYASAYPEYTFRHISLNMRCHDLGYSRDDIPYRDFEEGGQYIHVDGGYWEDLSVGHLDLKAAVNLANRLGNQPIFLVGHSSGGYYVADYCSRYADVSGRILLSPVISLLRSVHAWFPTDEALEAARTTAVEMVESGNGDQLIPVSKWFFAISARSLLQRLDEDDDAPLVTMLRQSTLPTLLLWGESEPRNAAWSRIFDELAASSKAKYVVPDADHNYLDHRDEVAQQVLGWVAKVVHEP